MTSALCAAWSINSRCPASGTTWAVALGMRAAKIRALTAGTIGSFEPARTIVGAAMRCSHGKLVQPADA